MKHFTRSLEKNRRLVFATTTEDGVGALHLRHKLPFYSVKKACDSLGFFMVNHFKHKDHLQIRNRKGDLVGTLVKQNLLLMPKYSKTKSESVMLAQALLSIIP